MCFFRVKTPFCGIGNLRSVAIVAGFIYLIFALSGVSTGFGYKTTNTIHEGYGIYGENYALSLLGVSSVVWIISNLLLLYGAITKQHKYILPWIYWQLVFVVIAIMVLVWGAMVLEKLYLEQPPLMYAAIAALSCVVPYLCTVIYFYTVVHSFYCDLGGEICQQDNQVTTNSPRNVMQPVSITPPRAPFVPQEGEENVYADVTSLNAFNNLGFAADSAAQDNLSYCEPRKVNSQQDTPDTTDSRWKVVVPDSSTSTGVPVIPQKNVMPPGSSTSTGAHVIPQRDVMPPGSSTSTGASVIPQRDVMPPGSSTSTGAPFIPQNTEENVHSNVTALNFVNNLDFAAEPDEQYDNFHHELRELNIQQDTPDTTNSRWKVLVPDNSTGAPVIPQRNVMRPGRSTYTSVPVIPQKNVMSPGSSTSTGVPVIPQRDVMPPGSSTSTGAPFNPQRDVMPPGSSTSTGAPFIPQNTVENVHSNVTALNFVNNLDFSAEPAEQYNFYHELREVNSQQDTPDTTDSRWKVVVPDSSTSTGSPVIPHRNVMPPGSSTSTGAPVIPQWNVMPPGSSTSTGAPVIPQRNVMPPGSTTSTGAPVVPQWNVMSPGSSTSTGAPVIPQWNVMPPGSTTSTGAPLIPQNTEENMHSNVTELNVINNSDFAAELAEQDDNLYCDSREANSKQDTPDTTDSPRNVMRPGSSTSPGAPFILQRDVMRSGSSASAGVPFISPRREESIYSNVTTPNALNNSGFAAAASAAEDNLYDNWYSRCSEV